MSVQISVRFGFKQLLLTKETHLSCSSENDLIQLGHLLEKEL